MLVIEINRLSVIKLPPNQFYRLEVAYIPRKLTTEDACDQSCYRNTGQMSANRSDLSETRFAEEQILPVIFEMHFDFPSFLIALVNPYGIVEKFIADKCVTNDFSILQSAPAHYECHLAVNVVTCYNSLIMMIFFQISPLTARDLSIISDGLSNTPSNSNLFLLSALLTARNPAVSVVFMTFCT